MQAATGSWATFRARFETRAKHARDTETHTAAAKHSDTGPAKPPRPTVAVDVKHCEKEVELVLLADARGEGGQELHKLEEVDRLKPAPFWGLGLRVVPARSRALPVWAG